VAVEKVCAPYPYRGNFFKNNKAIKNIFSFAKTLAVLNR
jgi:hypothetical protein